MESIEYPSTYYKYSTEFSIKNKNYLGTSTSNMLHTRKSLLFAMLLSAVAAQYGSAPPPPPPPYAPIYRPQAPPSGPYGGQAPMKQYYTPSYAAPPQPLPSYAPAAPIYKPAAAARPFPSYSAPSYGMASSSYQQITPPPMQYPPRQPTYNYGQAPTNFASPQQQIAPQSFAVPPTQQSPPSYESAPANLLAPPPPPSFSAPTSYGPPGAMQPSYLAQPMQFNNQQNYAAPTIMQTQQTAASSFVSAPQSEQSYGGPAASSPSCSLANNGPPVESSPEMQSTPIYGVPPTPQQFSSSSPAISSSEMLPMESAPQAAPQAAPQRQPNSSTDYLLPILYSAASSSQLPAASPVYESAPMGQQSFSSNPY